MIKNYLRVAFRNLRKYKAFSFINIIGLAVGIACCISIFLYVQDELSYDKFNKKSYQVYRITADIEFNNVAIRIAHTPSPLGSAIIQDFPEVVSFTRIRNFGFPVLRYKNKAFSEERFYSVDSAFFNVFTVKFLKGNPGTALTQPNTVVITSSMAKKYFGNENPMGKFLNADHRRDYIVTGVVEDFPHNSHFRFDFLGSLTTYDDSRYPTWLSNNYFTYILFKAGTDPVQFQKKLNDNTEKYISQQLKSIAGFTYREFKSRGNKWEYILQPLTSIHLNSHLEHELEANSDISYIYIFSIIALSILLIAIINFMNLSTARSERRAKEVGIRKALGSNKGQLVKQFIIESILMSFISISIAVMLVEIILPLFNNLSGKGMKLNLLDNIYTIPLLVIFAIIVGIFAGSYPAFYLSSFQPVQIIKLNSQKKNRKSFLRSGLVIFQFAVTIILFIGTFIIYNQLGYIQNKNLGFNKDQVVVIKKADDIGNQLAAFKQALLNNPNILSVSNSDIVPGNQGGDTVYKLEGASNQDSKNIRILFCDYNFVNSYQMKLNKGRFFSREHPSDTNAVVINQAAVKEFGLANPIGKHLMKFGPSEKDMQSFNIIGVIDDFNYESLHQAIRPLVIHLFNNGGFGRFVSVRIAPADYKNTIEFIEGIWKKFADNEAFEYNFFDQDWAKLYVDEQVTSKVASIFSILAIFVAGLGLLGLAAFVTEQRTKEIGIRKVLGASVPEILVLLSKEFSKWVLIANLLAWPLAYYFMNNWLKAFAYRINITPWIFISSGVLALVIALLTVSANAVKAATANPVKSLKYE
ncbi:MAG: ABC transporter permease [Ignavibacteriaceae bacterium]|nr:ABC transporter permease [Ignavibacteriaceae bacterium]